MAPELNSISARFQPDSAWFRVCKGFQYADFDSGKCTSDKEEVRVVSYVKMSHVSVYL